MLSKLVGWAEWKDIKELLSPQFFAVMPPRKIASLIKEMYGNFRNEDLFARATGEAEELCRRFDLDVVIVREPGVDPAPPVGDLVLRLYFGQLFHGSTTLIDLRPERFSSHQNQLLWSPSRLVVEWDKPFLTSIRALYRSFYTDDDEGFENALAQLQLQSVANLFRKHFGGGDQRAVAFDLDEFRATFRQILSRCKAEGIELHRQFGVLGVYLGTLYDHLESLGGVYDVRRAVETVGLSSNSIDPKNQSLSERQ
jgi:hypothetical protein